MPKTIQNDVRKLIMNIINYLKHKKDGGLTNIPIHNVLKLVVDMTGSTDISYYSIGKSTITNIYKKKDTLPSLPPMKKKDPIQNFKKVDDFDKCAIRHKINEFYSVRKEVPSLKNLLTALQKDIGFTGGREYLRLLVHSMGYKYKKCRNQRLILKERSDIAVWREDYLDQVKEARDKNMPLVYLDETFIHTSLNHAKCWQSVNEPGVTKAVSTGKRYIIVHAGGESGFVPDALLIYNDKEKKADYHDSMNKGNFKKWVLQKLVPNLSEPTCIVMDNARYHSFQINKPPTSNDRKHVIAEWLSENNIAFPHNASKDKLVLIMRRHKPEPVYEIDSLLSKYGHKVVRLPPYHCDLNPIEMIWGIVKAKVATKNISIPNDAFLKLVEDSFQEVTQGNWSHCCAHVIKIEDEYRRKGPLVESQTERFIIEVGGPESDSSASEESEEEFHSEEYLNIEYLESDMDE